MEFQLSSVTSISVGDQFKRTARCKLVYTAKHIWGFDPEDQVVIMSHGCKEHIFERDAIIPIKKL